MPNLTVGAAVVAGVAGAVVVGALDDPRLLLHATSTVAASMTPPITTRIRAI